MILRESGYFTSISPLQYDYLSKGAADTHNLLLYEKPQIQEFAKGSGLMTTLRLGVELDREKFKAAQLRPLRFRVKVSVMSSFPLQYYTLVGVYCK